MIEEEKDEDPGKINVTIQHESSDDDEMKTINADEN